MNIKILIGSLILIANSHIIINKGEKAPTKSSTAKTATPNKSSRLSYEKTSIEKAKRASVSQRPLAKSPNAPVALQKTTTSSSTSKPSPQDVVFNPMRTKSLDLKSLSSPEPKNQTKKTDAPKEKSFKEDIFAEKIDYVSAQNLINNKIKADKEYQTALENYQKSKASFHEKTKLAETRKIAFEKAVTATRSLAEFSNKGRDKSVAEVAAKIETTLGVNPSKTKIAQSKSTIIAQIKTALGLKPTIKEISNITKIMNEKISFMPAMPTTLQVRQFIQDCIDAFKNLGREQNAKVTTKIYEDGTRSEATSGFIKQHESQNHLGKTAPSKLETVITKDALGNIKSKKETVLDFDGYLLQETIYNNQGLITSKTTPSIFGSGGLNKYEYTYNQQNVEIGRTRTRTYADGRTPTITHLDKNDRPINV